MRKVIFFLALVFFAFFLFLILRAMKEKKEEKVIFLTGNIEVVELNVGFKIPGRIEKVFFKEGERVRKGDLIAKLESQELKITLEQQRAILEETEIRLSQLKKGARPQEIEQAKANLEAHEAELRKLKREYERAERLLKEGAVSLSYFEGVKSAYEARMALLKSAMESLSILQEGPREEEIRVAEKKVEQARIAIRILEEKIRETMLRSPIDGVILKKNVEEGEIVAAGTPVFTIGDLEKPWVKVYIPEDKIGYVRLGQKAIVSVDTFKGKTYEGDVSYISKEAEFTPKTVQTREERVRLVFSMKVTVKNENEELKPGMPADVRIVLDGK